MSRLTNCLESLRTGKFGLMLFYGYLVAIVLAFAFLAQTAHVNVEQNDAIAKQQIRQCLALKGATAYWRSVRESVIIRQRSDGRTVEQIESDATLRAALDKVISEGSKLKCP